MKTVTLEIELPTSALRIQAPRPVTISQHSSLATIGIKPRAYLESLSAFRAAGGEVLSVGRTRCVYLDAYLDWLAGRELADVTDNDDDDAAALAAAAGLRLVASPGRPTR